MNIDQIRELAKIANENNLESIELQSDNMILKIKMHSGTTENCHAPKGEQRTYDVIKEPAAEAPGPFTHEVKSPMVGVFYAAPSPDAQPYVTVGTKVKKGDILCIIEAMKLMNEITSDRDGEIVRICVENGQVVEFAQPLFQIS